MDVTLLITNYNYEKFLRRCLRSCINQSMSKEHYEILIVDDGSTDNSHHILREYSKHPNVKVIYNRANLGIGSASKIGASKALGKYIVRLDSDDYIHEDFIKFLHLFISTNKYDAVACDYYEIDEKENILSRKSQEKHPIACALMMKTDMLHEIGSYSDLKVDEDMDLMKRLRKECNIKYLNVPLYRYYIHPDSLSHSKEK